MSFSEVTAWENLRTGTLLAADVISVYRKLLQLGMIELEADLLSSKPYDHVAIKGEYSEKNQYFNRANLVGIPLLRQGATGFSKMYYWHMLNAISNYEAKTDRPLNKGMVCGNLGVSSLAEGDIDGGIAYLAWAMQEDRAWIQGNPNNSIFANELYIQFAEAQNRSGISQFGRIAPWIMLREALKDYYASYSEKIESELIFKELEDSPQHRALLEGALWTIHRNLCLLREENERRIYANENNVFTKLRLFDGIINLCRLVELRIKHHEKTLKILKPEDLETALKKPLGFLLQKVFGENWHQTVIPEIPKFEKSEEFNEFIKQRLNAGRSHMADLLLLLVIRNYSVHLADPDVLDFFANIEQIFNEIIGVYVYYLKYRKIL